jgi:hypothetical protein
LITDDSAAKLKVKNNNLLLIKFSFIILNITIYIKEGLQSNHGNFVNFVKLETFLMIFEIKSQLLKNMRLLVILKNCAC